MIDRYRNLQYLFKTIGDAIAFIYINKWDIKPLAFKESAGSLSGKKGAKFERWALRKAFELGRIAILNDITNCLRYGDITVPSKYGYPVILEMKSGKARNDRTKRQLQGMEKIINYWKTDRVEGLYEGIPKMMRVAAHQTETNHIEKLNEVVMQALAKGKSWLQVEDGVYYYVAVKELDGKDFVAVISKCAGTPFVFFVNEAQYSNTAYYPFSLSIEDPNAFLEFYTEEIAIFVLVDSSVIADKLASRGLTVNFEVGEPYSMYITFMDTKRKDKTFIRVSQHMLRRIAYEFMGLDWFLEETISRISSLPKFLET